MIKILDILRDLDTHRHDEIERWLGAQRSIAAPFITSSVDLRHSGVKLVPVDTNLYPAGFHLLSPAACRRAARAFAQALQEMPTSARKLLIIPENHTRNLSYLDNVRILSAILQVAGAEVRIGSLVTPAGETNVLQAPGGEVVQHGVERIGNRLIAGGFDADVLLLNNDLTGGLPEILEHLDQPLMPPAGMGWHVRRKNVHFSAYQELVGEFGKAFGIDPWLLSAEFHHCGFVDFKSRIGISDLARKIDRVLARVQKKYDQYGIKDAPYVFIKADRGTYGMGIMTVRSGEEILEINKKERNKMQTIKEGSEVHEVLIQEGVPTIEFVDDKPAETMIYMVDGVPIGGMLRFNGQRDTQTNLNAAGMEFVGLCDETERPTLSAPRKVQDCDFRSYGLVGALAALAAPRENYESFMLNL